FAAAYGGMNAKLAAHAAAQGNVFLRRQALAAGYNSDEINRLRGNRTWVTIRRGAYVQAEVWDEMSAVQRHRALVHAAVLSLDEPAVVSHASAAVMLDLPTWGLDLSLVHVTRADLHSPRVEGGVSHHAATLFPGDVIDVDGVSVTAPARTVIDVARGYDFAPSVVIADAVLRDEQVDDREELLRSLDRVRDWPGARNAGRVVEFADGRSASVGESRCRVLLEEAGLPRPELQVPVIDPRTGRLVGITDFYFAEQRTIGEFDGKQKYTGDITGDEDPGEIVWREKKREDRLRDLGYEVVRVITPDFDRPKDVGRRFRRAFARAAGR